MTDETSRHQIDANLSLNDALAALSEHLANAAPEAGWSLAALIPCELVVGRAAVACWKSPEAVDPSWEWALVSLDSGAVIDDRAAIRDAFALVAMHEALSDAIDTATLERQAHQVRTWTPTAAGSEPVETLQSSLLRVADAIEHLASHGPQPNEPMMARSDVLDRWGGMLRELERALEAVDIHAERWSRTSAEHDPEAVRSLWMLLADIRGSVVSQPVSVRLQAGRDAGIALAEQVLGS